MKTDLLASRHIGINEQDTTVMLRKIGVDSLDELIENHSRQYPAERATGIKRSPDGIRIWETHRRTGR